MGCASSAQPLVTSAGNEMVKAATHVASDVSKKTEDVVQGVRETMDSGLQKAEESLGSLVQNVKQEAQQTLHEKAEKLDEAKNTLLSKLHLDKKEMETKEMKSPETITEMESQLERQLVKGSDESESKMEKVIDGEACNRMEEHVKTSLNLGDNVSASSIEIAEAFAAIKSDDNQSDETVEPLKTFTNELIIDEEHKLHNMTSLPNAKAHHNGPDNDQLSAVQTTPMAPMAPMAVMATGMRATVD